MTIDGNIAVVGAPQDDDNENNSGSAYVFRLQPDGTWIQTQKLTQTEASGNAQFGFSVAISGNNVLVGALRGDSNQVGSGTAYLFELQVDGTWTTQQLNGSNLAADDEFGHGVSISNGKAVIGARFADDSGLDSGAVYIFEPPRYSSGDAAGTCAKTAPGTDCSDAPTAAMARSKTLTMR